MKKMITTAVLALVSALPAMAASTTVSGVLTDDMCTRKHMMPGKPNADCVRECVKHGAKYAVVSKDKVYVLSGKEADLSANAGKKVTITGDLKGNTLTVANVKAAE